MGTQSRDWRIRYEVIEQVLLVLVVAREVLMSLCGPMKIAVLVLK